MYIYIFGGEALNITIQVVKIGTRKTVLLFNEHLPSSPHLQLQPSVPHDDYQHGNGLSYAPYAPFHA